MKIASLILGILGGLAGIIGSIMVMLVGGIGSAFGSEGSGTVTSLGWVALLFSIIAIVGGSLAIAKPKIAGIMMLLMGVGGIICVSIGYVVAGPLLIIGGILALVGSRQLKTT